MPVLRPGVASRAVVEGEVGAGTRRRRDDRGHGMGQGNAVQHQGRLTPWSVRIPPPSLVALASERGVGDWLSRRRRLALALDAALP